LTAGARKSPWLRVFPEAEPGEPGAESIKKKS
jgi:hypothetical protein